MPPAKFFFFCQTGLHIVLSPYPGEVFFLFRGMAWNEPDTDVMDALC
jgi:hypothetical protein